MDNYVTTLNVPFLYKDLEDLIKLIKNSGYSNLRNYIPSIEEHLENFVSSCNPKVINCDENSSVFVRGKKYIPIKQLEVGDYAIFDDEFECVHEILRGIPFKGKFSIFYGEAAEAKEKQRKNSIVVPKGFVFIDKDMNKVNAENLYGIHAIYFEEELREIKGFINTLRSQVKINFYKKPLDK